MALIAASLPDGAEVLFAEEEFVSTVSPFAHRPGLRPRAVPLAALADEIREDTALVAVSAVQSRDGRVADLAAIRDAARRHGARTMVDTSQAAGCCSKRSICASCRCGHMQYLACAHQHLGWSLASMGAEGQWKMLLDHACVGILPGKQLDVKAGCCAPQAAAQHRERGGV